MNNLLLWLSALLILMLSALFVGPHFVDWNSYRSVFEEQATRLAGRTVTVEGAVNLRLLPAPYVSFERVKIAGDPNEAASPPLLTVDSYTLWLAVPPLLQGEIEAQTMQIDTPKLRLALNTDGTGNWNGIGDADLKLPFLPGNVAVNAMNISNGEIEIVDAKGKSLTRIAQLNGTLSARALTGPYKFVGDITNDTHVRELRWSTGRLDENGALRIKGALKDTGTGATFAADGLLQKLATTPVFTGALAGKLRAKRGLDEEENKPTGFELKSDVYIDTSSARLSEITILLDADGRPQIVNGTGQGDWQNGAELRLDLTSRWLDLDRLFPTSTNASLLDNVESAMARIHATMPAQLATTATFKTSQLNLGGELVDGVALELSRRSGDTRIKSLTANLPGAAKLNLKARIKDATGAAATASASLLGSVRIHGRNLSRFARWLNPEYASGTTAVDGAFAFESEMALLPDSIAFEAMRGEIRNTRFIGRLSRKRRGNSGLAMTLKSANVDLSPFFSDARAFGRFLRATVVPESSDEEPDSNTTNEFDSIDIEVGQIKIGASRFSDVFIDARHNEERVLEIKRAAFVSNTGLAIEVDGRIERDEARGSGVLRFVTRAPDRAALTEMMDLSGVNIARSVRDRLTDLVQPLAMAGSLRFGQPEDPATRIRFDGTIGSSPAVTRVRIEDDAETWRASTWNVSSDIAMENTAEIARLFGIVIAPDAKPEKGRLIAYGIGKPEDGLKSTIGLQSETLSATYEGTIASPVASQDGQLQVDGEVAFETTRTIPLLAQLGGAGKATVATSGDEQGTAAAARLTYADGTIRLDDLQVEAPSLSLKASVEVAPSVRSTGSNGAVGQKSIPRRIRLVVEAEKLALPALFALTAGTTSTSVSPTNSVWSDAPFDFKRLRGMDINASIRAAALDLGGGNILEKSVMQLNVSEKRILLDSLEGVMSGGQVALSGSLDRRPAGAELVLTGAGSKLALTGGASGAQDETGSNGARGSLDFGITLKGRGLSPRGIVSVLEGSGDVQTTGAQIPAFSSQVVHDVAADVAEDNVNVDTRGLKKRLAERLRDRPLPIGQANVKFQVRDGALQADDLRIKTAAATIRVSTIVDLGRMRLDTEWRVTPERVQGSKTALPPITVFYAGDARSISTLEPGFGVSALERELTVRHLEGNIDRLEGIRSLDQKKRKSSETTNEAAATSPARAVRPTVGQNRATDARGETTAVAPPKVRKKAPRKRKKTGTDLWQLNEIEPPVDLRLQTPESANPT